MSRDIKFRAWNERHSNPASRMIYGVNLDTESNVIMPDDEPWKIPLMQYTGLKDKNGKEIYEGDIVSVDHHYDGDSRVLAYNDTVIFEEGGFTLKKWFGHDLSMLALNGMCEVIGNIYENPELLK